MNRILTFFTKFFAVWVVLFGIVAYGYPKPFVALKGGMDLFFALTMFGIGAVLNVEDFRNIAKTPGIVLIGCAAQFTIMPLGAFVLARLFHLPPEIAVGLILTGSAPGAMASNVMSYIAEADTAYSVSLTTASTLLCPILTPGLTLLLAQSYLEVPVGRMFLHLLLTVVAPLCLGLALKVGLPRRMKKAEKVFPAISVTFIIFICSLVIALNRKYLTMMTGPVLLAAVVLNLYGMLAGYGVGSVFRLGTRRRRTLCIEIGMQNAGLGTVLALKHFSERSAIPAAVFVFICILTASLLVEIWRWKSEQQKLYSI